MKEIPNSVSIIGTANEFKLKNPILLKGQFGLESDTIKAKFGDGKTPYKKLQYITGGTIVESTVNLTNYYTKTEVMALLSQVTITKLKVNIEPIGLRDLSNTVFTTPDNFVTGSLMVFDEGTLQTNGQGFNENGNNQFTFTYVPLIDNRLRLIYVKQ